MNSKNSNPCCRCGKERVVAKKWKEVTGSVYGNKQEVIHIETVCPDAECQAIINKDLQKQKKKRDDIAREKQERVDAKKTKRKKN